MLWDFVFAVAAAVVIGFLVGEGAWTCGRLTDPAVNPVVGFNGAVHRRMPAEQFGASGLVAAVTAGLAVGQHAPEMLSPRRDHARRRQTLPGDAPQRSLLILQWAPQQVGDELEVRARREVGGGEPGELEPARRRREPRPRTRVRPGRAREGRGESVDSEPRLAADAIMKLVDSENPPLRLILCSVVLDAALHPTRERIATWERWEDVSRAAEHAVPMP